MNPPVPPEPDPPEPGPDPPTPTKPKFTYTSSEVLTGTDFSTVYSGVKLNGESIGAVIGPNSTSVNQLIHCLYNGNDIWYVGSLSGGLGIDFANPRATTGNYGYCLIDFDDDTYEFTVQKTGVGMTCHSSTPSDLVSVIASGVFDVEQE